MLNLFKPKSAQEKKQPGTNPEPAQPGMAEPAVAPVQTAGAVFNRWLYRFLSPETRVGRVMRPVLRWVGATLGLFALGLLVGYLVFYQPVQRELDAALQVIGQANQSASQNEKSLQTAQLDREQAVKLLQQAQTDLKKAASANDLLVVMVEIGNVRIALLSKEATIARTTLDQAQTDLGKLLPYLEGQDKTKADVLKTRLDLVAKELTSDPPAALADLERFANDLSDLYKKLFK